MIVTPFSVPTTSSLRLTPVKRPSDAAASASGMPAAMQAASAASALATLWRPGTRSVTRSGAVPIIRHVERDAVRRGRDGGRAQAGRCARDAIGDRSREFRGQRGGLRIVEVEYRDLRLAHEIGEQCAQFVHRFVVERDVVHHGDGWPVERDGAVTLVYLADEEAAFARQRAGERRIAAGEILHHRAVHHRRVAPGRRTTPSRSLPVVVDLPLVPATPMLWDAALNNCESSSARVSAGAPTAPRGHHVGHGVFHRGGDHHRLARIADARPVLREQRDAVAAQIVELRARAPLVQRPVGDPRPQRRARAGSAPGATSRCLRRCRRRSMIGPSGSYSRRKTMRKTTAAAFILISCLMGYAHAGTCGLPDPHAPPGSGDLSLDRQQGGLLTGAETATGAILDSARKARRRARHRRQS